MNIIMYTSMFQIKAVKILFMIMYCIIQVHAYSCMVSVMYSYYGTSGYCTSEVCICALIEPVNLQCIV